MEILQMKNSVLYFAYGSNLNPWRISFRCPSATTVGHAKLYNYRIAERLYADIDRRIGSTVDGVLYRISEKDLHALDRYEGAPNVYQKIWTVVRMGGKRILAVTYQMTPEMKQIRYGMPYPNNYRKICSAGADYHRIHNNFKD